MNKLLFSLAATAFLIGSTAIASAQSSNSNKDAALGMRDALTDPTIGESLGIPSTGAAAAAVSGNDPALGTPGRSESGWGNTGSAALSSEGQVSRGSERGNKGGFGEGNDR